jgi:hypothetical protein
MSTALAKKPDTDGDGKKPDADADAKPAFILKPSAVIVDTEGFATRRVFARLPENFAAQSLEDPNLWKLVQGDQNKSLRLFDRVTLVAFDETWFAETVVVRADMLAAVLSKPKITLIPARYDRLFEDDLYRVKWYGSGYAVERKSDGHRMTNLAANAVLAERDLARLYPSKVGIR